MPEFDRHVLYEEWRGGANPSRVRSGLAAYDTFAEALLRDEDFLTNNLDVLTSRCIPITNDGIMLMECKRERAARFLNSMAEKGLLGAAELRKAAEAYTQEVQVWHQAAGMAPWSGSSEEQRQKIADLTLRRKLSRLVHEAKVHEERAVEHVEKALKDLTGH